MIEVAVAVPAASRAAHTQLSQGKSVAGMIIRRVSADRSIDKVSSRQVRKVCTTSTVRAILATHFTVSEWFAVGLLRFVTVHRKHTCTPHEKTSNETEYIFYGQVLQ